MKLICPHCNSEFYVTRGLLNEYVYKVALPFNYKMRFTYFCSYSCWRANGGGKNETTKDDI